MLLLATVTGVAVTGALGIWQLSRAGEKEALQAAIEQHERQPALDGAALAAALREQPVESLLHRQAVLHGRWVGDRTLFLDNRAMEHRSGFYVLTPLRLARGEGAVLVLRGWAPRDFADRAVLPPVETPSGEVEVRGLLIERPSPVFALGQESVGPIRQNLDLEAFRRETGLPLAQVVVQQTGPASEGLDRRWPPPTLGVEKNYGYAVQWFGLCALFGVLYLWFQVVRPFLALQRRRG